MDDPAERRELWCTATDLLAVAKAAGADDVGPRTLAFWREGGVLPPFRRAPAGSKALWVCPAYALDQLRALLRIREKVREAREPDELHLIRVSLWIEGYDQPIDRV